MIHIEYDFACLHFRVSVRKQRYYLLCYYVSKHKVVHLSYSSTEKIGITPDPDDLLYCLIFKTMFKPVNSKKYILK